MDISSTMKYLNELNVDEIIRNKSLMSSLALKRLVKPILKFLGRDVEAPIWFYVGTRGDHIIVSKTYCSCKDFVINVMSRKKKPVCRHLIIQVVGSKKGLYRVVEIESLDLFYKIIHEISSIGLSPTLRRLLHRRSR